ncbi:PEPxxWA-CTERM sorting domain-containing protein [Sphingomonas sp. GB1N7]|uniref:PEPxxWA-CTERM sorting domain-containing protein n=1 Tax=Parasphingomonas caseinilytica TaxID=3096158 RepID=UPI002FCCA7A6
MNKMNALLAATMIAGAAIALPASATTYVISQTIGAGSVTGTITTDNTIGAIASTNITAFNLILNDGTATFNLTNSNGAVGIAGSALTATATGLFYNFSAAGTNYALFQAPNLGSSINYFCLQTSSCYNPTSTPGAGMRIQGALLNNSQTGNVQFGAVAAVPETATWGMMILGFGMIGAAARSRKVKTTVAYA